MFNQMIDHYSPLFTSIKTMFGYKSSSLLGASIFSAISIEAIFKYVLHGSFMGVSALMIITVSFLILVDWAFGSAASRKIANEAKLKEDLDTYKEHKFSVIGTNGSLIFDDTRDWSNKLIFNPSIINRDNSINFYPLENIYVDENEPLKNELQKFFLLEFCKYPLNQFLLIL